MYLFKLIIRMQSWRCPKVRGMEDFPYFYLLIFRTVDFPNRKVL